MHKMIPTIINFKLSDFFNVFIVRIAAMAVIMNKKNGNDNQVCKFSSNNFLL